MNIATVMQQAKQMQERCRSGWPRCASRPAPAVAWSQSWSTAANSSSRSRIDPEVVSKEDVEMLQDLILAAVNDAHRKVDEQLGQSMSGLLGGLKIPGLFYALSLPEPLTRLVEQLQKLPGIGAKSAQRLAFHILRHPREDAEQLCDAIRDVKERVTYCSICNNITDTDPCAFCTSATRDQRLICVVEEPQNVTVVEKTREFRGVYHVLMGALSPLHGVGPDELKIKGLLDASGRGGVDEVILATNPTVEGEATALYLARLLKPFGVRVTRIAMGIPVGSDLEYADEVTMTRAMEGRRDSD